MMSGPARGSQIYHGRRRAIAAMVVKYCKNGATLVVKGCTNLGPGQFWSVCHNRHQGPAGRSMRWRRCRRVEQIVDSERTVNFIICKPW